METYLYIRLSNSEQGGRYTGYIGNVACVNGCTFEETRTALMVFLYTGVANGTLSVAFV